MGPPLPLLPPKHFKICRLASGPKDIKLALVKAGFMSLGPGTLSRFCSADLNNLGGGGNGGSGGPVDTQVPERLGL